MATQEELQQALECLAKNRANVDSDLRRLREDTLSGIRKDPIPVLLALVLLGPPTLLVKLAITSAERSVRRQVR